MKAETQDGRDSLEGLKEVSSPAVNEEKASEKREGKRGEKGEEKGAASRS